MFNLREILGAHLHVLSTHGHIFVHIFVAFLLDTVNRFYSTKYRNVLWGFFIFMWLLFLS